MNIEPRLEVIALIPIPRPSRARPDCKRRRCEGAHADLRNPRKLCSRGYRIRSGRPRKRCRQGDALHGNARHRERASADIPGAGNRDRALDAVAKARLRDAVREKRVVAQSAVDVQLLVSGRRRLCRADRVN